MILPLRIGAGNPIDATSKFQPRTFCLNLSTNSAGPFANRREIRARYGATSAVFTRVPPISTTRIFLFMSDGPKRFGMNLPVASAEREDAERAWLLRLLRRAGRPAFHYFEGKKPEQQLPGRFQSSLRFLAIC